MNEDEHGITPANVTAITIDRPGRDWRLIIEQGNGDVIKVFELTEMERQVLAGFLDFDPEVSTPVHVQFVDLWRE